MTQEGYWSVALWNCLHQSLHMVGILFSMKHLLSIASSHLWALGPGLFSCSTKTSSLPAALLFFSNATPLLYSSSLKGYTKEVYPSVAGGSTVRFAMLPLSLTKVGVQLGLH